MDKNAINQPLLLVKLYHLFYKINDIEAIQLFLQCLDGLTFLMQV